MSPVNAHPASQHALDPHDLPLQLRALRLGFAALKKVSRPLAVRAATHLFVTPRRHHAPAREREVLRHGERRDVELGDQRIATWTFGDVAAPHVLLVHGWEGRGGQLAPFVQPLVDEGLRVTTFDHIGHGHSSARRSSLVAMRDGLNAVAEAVLPAGTAPHGIVGHSMGSVASTLVFDERWPDTRAVYVAPPYDLVVYFSRYLELATGDDSLLPEMLARMEERYDVQVEDVHYDLLLPRRTQPLLIVHATDDRDVPIEVGRNVAAAWPGARMLELEGAGHRRVLKRKETVRAAVEFLRP